MPRKKEVNPISEVWIEKSGNMEYTVHVTYVTGSRTTDQEYKAHSFDRAQKIYAAITNQDLEKLRDYEDKRRKLEWDF